jgi:hypothetical protein
MESSPKRSRHNEQYQITQVQGVSELTFSNTLVEQSKSLIIFEIPKKMVEELSTGRCRIVGDEVNDAVLCTFNRTYLIKKVETSNSVYLVPPSDRTNRFELSSLHHEYYEV